MKVANVIKFKHIQTRGRPPKQSTEIAKQTNTLFHEIISPQREFQS